MKIIRPPMIIILPTVVAVPAGGYYSPPLIIKPMPIRTKDNTATNVPPCKICLRPSLVKR